MNKQDYLTPMEFSLQVKISFNTICDMVENGDIESIKKIKDMTQSIYDS